MNKETIKGRDIVIVGQQPWDTAIGSNCKDIAVELSKNNRVLYVNSALDRITLLKGGKDPKINKRKRIINGHEDGLAVISKDLWNLYPDILMESVNWIDVPFVFNLLNKRNNRLFSKSIQKALKKLDFKDVILFNDNDMFKSFYLKEYLKPAISIYYSRDYMLAVDYWKKHGERLEPELIRKSDLCVANSVYLTDYCKQYNPQSYYIGQGCDLRIFSKLDKTQVIPEINALKGPVIGYVGAMQSIRLDMELIAHIAVSRPDWNVVLVGPEDGEFQCSDLHHISNVHFLGSQKPADLPAYINSFDVCINPQLVNQVTIGNYPRKIDEYLAMGKPVVATHTQAVSIFSDCIYLAKDKISFVSAIEEALVNNSEEKEKYRISVAMSHSWENSVNELYKAINNFTKQV